MVRNKDANSIIDQKRFLQMDYVQPRQVLDVGSRVMQTMQKLQRKSHRRI